MRLAKIKMQVFDKNCITSCTPLLNISCIILAKLIDTFLKSRQKKRCFGELMENILRQQYGLAS